MLLKWKQEIVMWVIMDLSEEILILSVPVKVVDGIDNKEDHNFLETFLMIHPLLRVGILTGEMIKVPSSRQ